jgi:small subunit ribosomal protein S3
MGQKINPISFRIGVAKDWVSRWFFPAKVGGTSVGKYPYARFLREDEAIRAAIREKITQAGIAGIEIERTSNRLRVTIKAARPGFVIGQGGKGIEELTKFIERQLAKIRDAQAQRVTHPSLSVNVEELKRTEVSAAYVAQQVAWDLERRMPFRRTMKKYLDVVMQNRDARGAKILLSGRLNGAEIARTETLKRGSLPLQTLRANIDYGTATAYTTYGTIGIDIWINKGMVFAERKSRPEKRRS